METEREMKDKHEGKGGRGKCKRQLGHMKEKNKRRVIGRKCEMKENMKK